MLFRGTAHHDVLNKRGVRCWMQTSWRDCFHRGQLDWRRLAEKAAHAFDYPEWLNDPNHWIWELARGFDPDRPAPLDPPHVGP